MCETVIVMYKVEFGGGSYKYIYIYDEHTISITIVSVFCYKTNHVVLYIQDKRQLISRIYIHILKISFLVSIVRI